ncbi:hypothetical protein L6R46_21935, partial [Myxococcota bacterium]|nr:hypothetical protein [Myxococcota bacterium]
MTPPAQPIRGDLYCAKRLEQFATELASTHRISPGRRRGRALLARQRDNRRTLHRALKSIALD